MPTALGAELVLANGHKGSLFAGDGVCRWSGSRIRRSAKWLLAQGDSVLKVDPIWRHRKGTENGAIFKTATFKIRSSSKMEAGFKRTQEPGCWCHQILSISLQTEIKCQIFHSEQIPSLNCHFPFSTLNTSGQPKHWVSHSVNFDFNFSTPVYDQGHIIALTKSCTYTHLYIMYLPIVFLFSITSLLLYEELCQH